MIIPAALYALHKTQTQGKDAQQQPMTKEQAAELLKTMRQVNQNALQERDQSQAQNRSRGR
ncbi:hypothetical protein [Rhodopirellula bahusiensis]|uniref:hypothetical protein n=1 Tax=Rhodopirellula bahusiensis TaxID=2014065 RepID=UPI0032651A31